MKRIMATSATTLGLLAAGIIQSSIAAAAPPEPGNASCMGYEASAISPPGTSDEAPDGMPNFLSDIDAFFVDPDGEYPTRGRLIQFFTKLPADSHEGCDEALIEAVFGGEEDS